MTHGASEACPVRTSVSAINRASRAIAAVAVETSPNAASRCALDGGWNVTRPLRVCTEIRAQRPQRSAAYYATSHDRSSLRSTAVNLLRIIFKGAARRTRGAVSCLRVACDVPVADVKVLDPTRRQLLHGPHALVPPVGLLQCGTHRIARARNVQETALGPVRSGSAD